MLRSQNNYITSVLILFMPAAVCQSNFWFVVGTNTNHTAGELCGGSSICSDAAMHTAYAQRDKMVLCVLCVTVLFHYFSHPRIIFHVCRIWFSTNAATDVSIALALLWQLSQIKSFFKATQKCVPPIIDDYLHLIIHTHILFTVAFRPSVQSRITA